MSESLGELTVKLGVKADTFAVRDFSRAIGDIPLSVAAAITSLAGISFGFIEMTKNVLEMTSGFQAFTAETGLNVQALQQWQQVAKQAGLSGDVVTSSVKSLSSLMAQMRLGRGLPPAAAQAFGMMGFGPRDLNLNATDMLNKLQEGAKGKDPAQVAELLKALGVAPEMLRLFQTPRSERESIRPIMSSGDIAQMAEFQKELANFNSIVMKEFVPALKEVEPYMKDLAEALGFIIVKVGGWVGKGIGEDARAFNMIREEGLGKFFTDFINGSISPAMIKSGEGLGAAANVTQTNHIYGVNDPNRVVDELDRQSKASLRKAASDLQKGGN